MSKIFYTTLWVETVQEFNYISKLTERVRRILEYADSWSIAGSSAESIEWLDTGTNKIDTITKINAELNNESIKIFPWNKEESFIREVWDPTANGGTGGTWFKDSVLSLKQRLYTPGQVKIDDIIGDIGIGIAMIMDELEKRK